MSPLLSTAIFFTLGGHSVAMALALWRLLRGPSAQDRVLALDFISINGMLVVLVSSGTPATCTSRRRC